MYIYIYIIMYTHYASSPILTRIRWERPLHPLFPCPSASDSAPDSTQVRRSDTSLIMNSWPENHL